MILKDKNKEVFGYEMPPAKTHYVNGKSIKYKIWAECQVCNIPRMIGYSDYLSNCNKNQIFRCGPCQNKSNEGREQRSKQAKQAWKNHSYRSYQEKRITKLFQSDGHRKLVSERNKRDYETDPGKYINTKVSVLHTEKAKINHKKALSNPAYRELHRQLAFERFKDPEYKARISKGYEAFSRSGKSSNPELLVKHALDELRLEFIKEKSVGPYNFDFYLSKYDLYIEVQGEYWHNLPKNKQRDKTKLSYLESACPNSQVLYIWEHETLTPGRIKNKILEKIGLPIFIPTIEEFDFKQIVVKSIETNRSDFFLRCYHYAQEGRKGKRIYGAFLNNELTAVCKFSPVVRKEVAPSIGFSTKEVFELDRFCIKPTRQKRNFASWFLSRCTKLFLDEFIDVKHLVSFADTTHGHIGTVYKAANWKEINRTKPDYVYVDQNGWMMHKKTLYNHARSVRKTERKFAQEKGYTKIWGKEKIKFIYSR